MLWHGYIYIFLEWCNKETFEENTNDVSVKLCLTKIQDALYYLRHNNIIHRISECPNILLHEKGGQTQIKLSDFCFAKFYQVSTLLFVVLHSSWLPEYY